MTKESVVMLFAPELSAAFAGSVAESLGTGGDDLIAPRNLRAPGELPQLVVQH